VEDDLPEEKRRRDCLLPNIPWMERNRRKSNHLLYVVVGRLDCHLALAADNIGS
jgi:hypothetical protein